MKTRMLSKGLVVAVILLFLGLAIQPSVAVQPEQEIDVEPKDYLFQTIIDIANNPDVKNLLEQYDNDLFKVDIDRSVYRKILFRNPRLFRSMIFTKPSFTYEYLDKTYNNGIEILNIISDDKTIEIIESLEFNNLEVFGKINRVITNNKELFNKITTLTKINEDYKIICTILILIFIPLWICLNFFGFMWNLNPESTLWSIIFYPPLLIFGSLSIVTLYLLDKFCNIFDPYNIGF